VEAGAWLGSCHGVASGMPGTQLPAWEPEEDDRREEMGWAGWASPCAGGKSFSFFSYFLFCFFLTFVLPIYLKYLGIFINAQTFYMA